MQTPHVLVIAAGLALLTGCDSRAALEEQATAWLAENRAAIEVTLDRGHWILEHADKTERIDRASAEDMHFLTYSMERFEETQTSLSAFLDPDSVVDWALDYDYEDLAAAASNKLDFHDHETIAVWKAVEKTRPILRDSDDPEMPFIFESGHIRGVVTLLQPRDRKVLARLPFEAFNRGSVESYDSGDTRLNKEFALERLQDQLLTEAEKAAQAALEQARLARR